MDINQIKEIAHAFRKAFESTDLTQAPGNLSNFPSGCCTWASLFIATFLRDRYGLSFKRIDSGAHSNGCQHEWIEINGIVIDITADQFDDSPAAVIVESGSPWHLKFDGSKISDYYLPLHEYAKAYGCGKLLEIYQKIEAKVIEIISASNSIRV